MKFNSFDELINYLHGKELSTLDISIVETPQECGGECSIEPVAVEPVTVEPVRNVPVRFNSLNDKPVMEFEVGPQSILVVEEFEYIPNTCSTTKVKLLDRELTIGVCENENGLPVAKFDVIVDEQYVGVREFVLVTDADKYTNTIALD